jgi:hypothetical protein
MKKRSASWLLAGLVLVVLLYPEKLTIVPAYRVKIVDQFGTPMPKTAVSELWQQTSVQRTESVDLRMTNAHGEALLPERTLRSPLAERILGCLAYMGRAGVNAPCGSHFSISAAGDLRELERVETRTGILKRQHLLVLTIQQCEQRDPTLC